MADIKQRATLVMFSSGVDSTYTLVKLLRETNDEVFAHHIHMINPEGRHEIEAERSRKIVDWCAANIRPLKYSESSIDHRNLRWFGYDIMSVGFEAGIIAHSFHRSRKRMLDRWTIGTCLEEGHDEERFQHVRNCCAANCYPHQPPEFFMLPIVSKSDEVAELPEPVLELCWTCRQPVKKSDGTSRECGKCKTCKLMLRVRMERYASDQANQPPESM